MALKIIDVGLKFNSNHSNRSGAPKGIALHHAAGDGSVSHIHNIHIARGYAGIGYHIYVRKDGSVYRGRPESWLGAHTVGYNDWIGVSVEGNFENEKMSDAQKNAVIEVIRYLIGKYGNLTIKGHRDLDATACPGKNYPFNEIVTKGKSDEKLPEATKPSGSTSAKPATVKQGKVLDFQKACIADGITFPVYGPDGMWGSESKSAACELVNMGDKGERVKLIQKYVGASVDGAFGEKTEEAVKAYQRSVGLDDDGVVGCDTWMMLLGVTQPNKTNVTKVGLIEQFQEAAKDDGIAVGSVDGIWGPNTADAASQELAVGSRGERVELAQSILKGLGYDLGEYGVDGAFGGDTKSAVSSYQGKMGLKVDGVIGLNTWKSLLKVKA